MKKPPPSQLLEQQLRDGAQHRRATLDRLAPDYPVGDYPPRSAERRAEVTGPGVVARLAWLLGLGGLTTAGVVGLVTLVGVLVLPDPSQPSPALIAAQPQPQTLGTSVRSLVAGLGQLEARMGEHLNPSVDVATSWPDRLGELSAVISDAELGIQHPIETEFIALRADLRTATDYIRDQWRVAPKAGPTGGLSPRYESAIVAG